MNAQFKHILSRVEKADIVAFDVETTGVNVRKDSVFGLGIALSASEAYYVDNPTEMRQLSLALQGKKLIAWNAYFDLEMIWNNFSVSLWGSLLADVICMKHTVEEEPPFALKEVAAKEWGLSAKAEQEEMKASIKANGGGANEFIYCDRDIMAKYCKQDCILTYRLFEKYEKMLKADRLTKFFYEDEVMPLYKEVTRLMMSEGVPVDLGLAKSLQRDITKDIKELESKIAEAVTPHLKEFTDWYMDKNYPVKKRGKFAQTLIKVCNVDIPLTKKGVPSLTKSNINKIDNSLVHNFLIGTDVVLPLWLIRLTQTQMMADANEVNPFNYKSKHHLKKLFFDVLGETPVSKTEKGEPQVNDEFLELMSKKYEWVALLQDYNKLNKLKSSYIDRVLTLQEDGIFYPQFFQHRTISGRYGSDLQQLPRPATKGFSPVVLKYRNQIRRIFIAGDGYKFIDNDYESLEPHIFAHVSGDSRLQEIFHKGHDFYSTIAIATEKLTGVSADKKADNFLGEVNPEGRQKAKAYSLGIPYGMEDFALGKTLGIEQEEAAKLINDYLTAYPDLFQWMKDSNDAVRIKGWVSSQAGRRRRFTYAHNMLRKWGTNIVNPLWIYENYGPPAHGYGPGEISTDDFCKLPEGEEYVKMKKIRSKVKNALNNAKNFQIQSLAASITNRACIQIARWLDKNGIDGHIAAQIHDQIIVRVAERHKLKAQHAVQQIMEKVYRLDVPLKAPAEIGDNFADAH